MRWALFGLLVGIIIGFLINYTIPIEYIKYTAVIILGILDILFEALKTEVEHKEHNTILFLGGFFFNIALALGITLLGEKLGLDLYLAATVVFTFRIFASLSTIQHVLLERHLSQKRRS